MAASGVLGKLAVLINWEGRDFQKGIEKAQKNTKQFGHSVRRAGDEMSRIFVRGMQAGTAALTAFGGASVKIGSDFEAAMQFVGATANATGDEMKLLEKEARLIGSTTLFTARQAAQGMTEFARAGMTTNQIVQASRPAMLLAGATMTNMQVATEGMSATLRQFGLETSEAARVSDVLALATRRSLFDLQGLLTAMKYGGTQARAYGMNLEEAVAAMMEFRNLGLEAHQAGVYFRMMLAKTGKVTPEAERELHKYGLTLNSISMKHNTFSEVLKNLAEKDIPKAEGAFERMFGVRAGPQVQALVDNFKLGRDEFDQFNEELMGAAGTTADMYNRVLDTVSAQWKIARSAFEELMIMTFQSYGPALKEFLTMLGETIQFTAQYLGTADDLGQGLTSTLQGMTQWLGQNQVRFAMAIREIIDTIQYLISWLVTLLSWWKLIATTMATIFVVNKVYIYVAAIIVLVEKLKILGAMLLSIRLATISIGAVLSGFSLGMLPAIAAVIAGLTTIVALMWNFYGATNSAADELERLKGLEADRNKAILAGYTDTSAVSKEYLGTLQEELRASKDLDGTTKGHINHLQQMTESQMKQNVADGKWVKLKIEGKEVMISQALVFDLYNKKTDRGIALHKQLGEHLRRQNKDWKEQGWKIEEASEQAENFNDQISSSVYKTGALTDYLSGIYSDRWGTELAQSETMLGQMRHLRSEHNRVQLNGFREYQDQEMRLRHQGHKKITEDAEEGARISEANQKKYVKLLEKREKADKKWAEYKRKLLAEIDILESKGVRKKEFALKDELAQMRIQIEERLKLEQKGSDAWIKIEADAASAVSLIRRKHLLMSLAEFEAKTKDFDARMRAAATDSAEEEVELRRRIQTEELTEMFKIATSGMKKTSKEYIAIQTQYSLAWRKLNRAYRAEDNQEQRAENIQWTEQTEDAIKALEQIHYTELEKIYAAHLERMTELRLNNATEAQKQAQELLTRAQQKHHAEGQSEYIQYLRENGEAALKAHMRSQGAIGGLRNNATKKQGILQVGAYKLVQRTMFSIFKGFAAKRASILSKKNKLQNRRDEYEKTKHTLSHKQRMAAEQELAKAQRDIGKERLANFMEGLLKLKNTVADVVASFKSMAAKGKQAFQFFTGFEFNLRGIVEEFSGAVDEAKGKGAKVDFKKKAKEKVGGMVDQAVQFMEVAIESIPYILEALGEKLPGLLNSAMAMIPQIIDAFVQNIGPILDAILAILPVAAKVLMDALPKVGEVIIMFVVGLIEALPDIIAAILTALPTLIEALMGGIVMIIQTVIDVLPAIFEMVIQSISDILKAIISALPTLIPALVELAMLLFAMLYEMLPAIIEQVAQVIPLLLMKLFEMIPPLIEAVVRMLPRVLTAFVGLIPFMIIAVIKAIPAVIEALINGLIFGLGPMIPKIIVMIITGVGRAILELIESIGQAIGDLFRTKKGKEKAKARRETRAGNRDKDLEELYGKMNWDEGANDLLAHDTTTLTLDDYYSGISYVPANMRVNVHQGEAILPADRNPYGVAGGQAFAGGPGAAAGGGQAPIDIAIMAEGRLLDAVQVTAMDRGHAPGITDRITRASGIAVGFDRGRFDYWTK